MKTLHVCIKHAWLSFTLYSAPSTPLNVTAHNISSTAIIVTWEPPSRPNGIIRSYRVEFSRSSDGVIDGISTASTSVIISLLEKFTTYQVQAFASTVAEGDGSNVVTVTTDEDSKLYITYICTYS